jgi:hypothetical protein
LVLQIKINNLVLPNYKVYQRKTRHKMKKLLSAVAVIAIVSAFTSCKPKEKCPAYGKVNPDKTNKEVRI